MTIATWPPELNRFEREPYQAQPQDPRRARQGNSGPPGYGRGFSSYATQVSLSLICTRAEKALFDNFWRIDLAAGSLPFRMRDPVTDGWHLLDSTGQSILDGDGTPLLISETWLCLWGDAPTESVVEQVKFRKTFTVWVMP